MPVAADRGLPIPACCREIDSISDRRERFETVVRGVIAGNIFDLGAAAGAEMFNSGQVPMPWENPAMPSLRALAFADWPHLMPTHLCL